MPINLQDTLEEFKRKFAQEYTPTTTTVEYVHDVDTGLRYNIDAIRYTIDAGKIQNITFCENDIPFAFYYEPEPTDDCTEILDLLSDT